MCKVSVIIPVFNVEKYLEDCLRSVLGQDFEDMEILCVDDGSTDGSQAILQRYAERDSRLHIICSAGNQGPSYARNRAIEQATGEYIFFLDSDDRMPEGTLQAVYETAVTESLDVLLYGMCTSYEDGLEQREKLHIPTRKLQYPEICAGWQMADRMIQRGEDFWPVWLFLWRRAFLQEHRISFHEGVIYEDTVFVLQGLLFAKRVHFLPRVCYHYRRRAASITSSRQSQKHLEGSLAAMADTARLAIERRQELPADAIRIIGRSLMEQLNATHSIWMQMEKNASLLPQIPNAAENLAFQLVRSNRYCYVSGELSEAAQQRLRSEQDIIIYGVGQVGREVLGIFEDYGIRNYHLAVTEKKETDARGLLGLVHPLKDYQPLREKALVVVAVLERLREEMKAEARRLGFQRVVEYYEVV